MNHERRNEIGEAFIDHEVTGIAQNGRMKAGNISHQVVEAVACRLTCTVQIQTIERLHDIRVIRDLKIQNNRLTEFLQFNILTVVLADGNRRINDLRDYEHPLADLLLHIVFFNFKSFEFLVYVLNALFARFRIFLLALAHQCADLLGYTVALCTQIIAVLFGGAVLFIQVAHLIDQRKFFVLELLLDIFFDEVRILTNKLNVNHLSSPL